MSWLVIRISVQVDRYRVGRLGFRSGTGNSRSHREEARLSVQITAMHMSDGLVNASTSVVFGILAIAVVAFCGWRARTELDERTVLLVAWSRPSSSRSR